MKEDPYRLARDIRGIGFRTADQLAEKLGIPKDSMLRARAGVSYALMEAVANGDCGLPQEDLLLLPKSCLRSAARSLPRRCGWKWRRAAWSRTRSTAAPCVFLPNLHRAEQAIAAAILKLRAGAPSWLAMDADKALAWVEGKLGVTLAPGQRIAVGMALGAKLAIITGGPGVGKTTIIRSILHILKAKGVEPLLAAPTGRAAKRLSESTGLEAKTIHRLLEFDPKEAGFLRGADLRLDCGLLVLDEVSMVDVPLMAAVLKALPDHAALLLVGDVDQLPSVGPGQVLADLISSGSLPVARLTEIFRQAAASRIITIAYSINRGTLPDLTPPSDASDFYFVEAADGEDAAAKIVKVVAERIPARFQLDPVREVQVLYPMNRGSAGARALNPPRQDAPAVERFGFAYRIGDKVMQTENNYDRGVFNGDLGFITAIDMEEAELLIEFDGRAVAYPFGELDEVTPAFATTIHKSQGSEGIVTLPSRNARCYGLRHEQERLSSFATRPFTCGAHTATGRLFPPMSTGLQHCRSQCRSLQRAGAIDARVMGR